MKVVLIVLISLMMLNAQTLLLFDDSGVSYGDPPDYEGNGGYTLGVEGVELPYPSGVEANDILIIQYWGYDAQSTHNLTIPDGWTSFYSNNITVYRFEFLWKRADGTETGNLSITATGVEDVKAIMSRWSGCIGSGTPTETDATLAIYTTNDSAYTRQITTLAPNRLAVCMVTVVDNITLGAMTNYGEVYDLNDAGGVIDGSAMCVTLDVANAGIVPADGGALSGTDQHLTLTFALKPTE